MIKIIGIAVSGTIIYVILKKYCPEYAVLAQIGAVIIVAFIAYPYLCDMLDLINNYTVGTELETEYFGIIIKSLGIAVVAQFSSDICRDNGSSALASQIEFAGKIIMISAAIPVIKGIVELTVQIIDKI